MRKLIILFLFLLLASNVCAQEVISAFDDRGLTVLNNELRKMRVNILAAASISINDGTTGILDLDRGGTGVDLSSQNQGDIYYDNGSTNGFVRLTAGSENDILTMGATIPGWSAPVVTTDDTVVFSGSTTLMLHCNGEDSATALTNNGVRGISVTFVGTAQLDDAQFKFSNTSLLLDGNSDSITLPDADDWNLGDGDWTIEALIRYNDNTGVQQVITHYLDADNAWMIFKDASHKLTFRHILATIITAEIDTDNAVLSNNNQWYHIRIVRSGNTPYIFVDGVSVAITEQTSISGKDLADIGAGTLHIGESGVASNFLNGWMDEIRINPTTAISTSNFTPPTNRLPIINSVYRN